MGVLPKVLGLTVAGVVVIVLYLACSVFGQLFGVPAGGINPLGFSIYLGLALTATFLAIVMFLASTGGSEA